MAAEAGGGFSLVLCSPGDRRGGSYNGADLKNLTRDEALMKFHAETDRQTLDFSHPREALMT